MLKVIDATGVTQNLSTTLDAAGNLVGSTCITDPISGLKQTVSQLHSGDQQSVPGTANSSFSTGVAQLQDNVSGLVNRQREIGQDNASPLGITSGGTNFAMQFKTTCTQNLSSGVTTMTLVAVTGLVGGVAWSIRQGSKLVIDVGASQETLTVQSVNTGTKVVTFTASTQFAHNGSVTAFPVVGMTFNQERDASGENDGASGAGTAIAAEYLYNGGDPSGGNYDRGRSTTGKGLTTQTISAGGGAGSTSLTVGAAAGLQPGTKVLLYKSTTFPAAGSFESVNIDLSYTPASTAVILASAIVGAVGYDRLAYDAFAALGPGLSGFTPFGIGIDAEALYDPISGLYVNQRQAPGAPGTVLVSSDGVKSTFRYAGLAVTPAATPTDFILIQGSATKTGRIKRIKLTGVATANGNMPVQLIRRSSAPTGGTLNGVTAGKHDVNDAAPTLVISTLSTNPTSVGTSAGNEGADRLFMPAVNTGGPFSPVIWDFATRQDKAVVLRGTTDFIAVNLNGAAVPAGGAIDFEIETEEDNS